MNTIWTVCLLMVLGAEPVETSPTATTRLYVRSTPPGARVSLDGKELGTTDGLFLVPAGIGRLNLTLDGQQPEIRQVEISEGRITRVEVTLQRRQQTPVSPAVKGGTPPAVGTAAEKSKITVLDLTPGRTGRPAAPAPASSEVEKALESDAKLQFVKVPLADVVEFLRGQYKINVAPDKRALEQAGVGTDTPVTFAVSGIPLQSALTLLLRDLGLTWTVRGDVLEIGTREEVDARLVTRVYDVSDLTGNSPALEALIRSILEPTSWDENGGPGSIVPDRAKGKESLVIAQSERVHRRLGELLADLRTVARQPADKLPVALSREGYWRQTPQTDAVRKALEKKLACEFVQTPLADVVAFLRDKTKVPVMLDRPSLSQAGVEADATVTFTYKDIALQEAMPLILRDLGLTYAVSDDVLLVTTPSDAEDRVAWAIYPVGDLMTTGRTIDELINLITRTIAPTAWDSTGGPGSICGTGGVTQVLVVSQSGEIHRQIAALLGQLRRP